ncbi:tetratricopeptide repeat protein [Duganella callida]|uniref:Sel1 repeat family protein n=1 Tax=Duganella callida TaxID=2561932 RepID=A0A4Y9SG70_9BURK|nr:tetratricopeptide repeat protein [Duganella callida]TFW19105.1 sel1 repeat family protein [Duganella callida]
MAKSNWYLLNILFGSSINKVTPSIKTTGVGLKEGILAATILMAACGTLRADELSDAQRLWENKDFKQAFKQFGVLAERGNPAAQLQLGEMYGFGEGTPQDTEKAVYWLQRAQAAGSPDAAESLALVRERSRRQADIAYYVTSYDGAALRYENYHCVRPTIPAVSKTNQEIHTVNAGVVAWTECYGRFVLGINNSLPATKTIPPDVLKLMSNEEYQRAAALIERTGRQLTVEPRQLADTIMAENQAWKTATEKFAGENNKAVEDQAAKNKLTYDVINRENDLDFKMRQDILRSRKSP